MSMSLFFRIAVSVVAFMGTMDIAYSQNYTLSPDDTLTKTGTFDDLETLSIQQINTSQDTIHLKWKKIHEDVPPYWDATVCDNVNCYTSLVDSGTMNPVYPGEYGFILLHITPRQTFGTAIIRYAVWDINNASKQDTLTFILTVNPVSGFTEIQLRSGVFAYPNPTNKNVELLFADNRSYELKLFDLSGKLALHTTCKQNCILPLSHLNDGVYTLVATTENIFIQSCKIIVQK